MNDYYKAARLSAIIAFAFTAAGYFAPNDWKPLLLLMAFGQGIAVLVFGGFGMVEDAHEEQG